MGLHHHLLLQADFFEATTSVGLLKSTAERVWQVLKAFLINEGSREIMILDDDGLEFFDG